MKHRRSLMLPLILFGALAICLPVYADDNTIYGRYKKNGGQLRIVSQGSTCLPSEVPISWNQTGSPGPAGPAGAGASVTVHQMEADLCAGGYGWCPDGFKWISQILDSAVNGSSVIEINVINPLLYDYGCEVTTKGAGELLIFCIGDDYVKPGAILQYAVFKP